MEDNKQYTNDNKPVETDSREEFFHEKPPVLKKRINWIKLALVLIVIGLLVYGISWAAGARSGFITFENGWFRVVTSGNSETHNINISTGQTINEININAGWSNVIIEPAARNADLGVTLSNISQNSVSYTRDTLTINAAEYSRNIQIMSFGFNFPRYEIRVQIPAGQDIDINITTSSGTVRVNDINPENLNIRTTSGGIRINDINTNSLDLRSTSGSIRSQNLNFSDGNVQSSSGSINLTNASWGNLSARSTSGSIRLRSVLVNDINSGETTVQSSSGSSTIELRNRNSSDFNYTLRASTGSVRADGMRGNNNFIEATNIAGNHTIRVNASSGSIRLSFNN